MKATLIISIYKNIEFLKVILDSLSLQTVKQFEIIISEDGSDAEVKQFIDKYPFTNPYKHLSRPDTGWTKNAALNDAIRHAATDWLIFIDGDCVPHPRFVEMHLRFAKSNRVLIGKRVKLNAKLSSVLAENVYGYRKVQKTLLKSLMKSNKNGIQFSEEGLFVNPNGVFWLLPKLRRNRSLIGSNMSFSKKAILNINGFDEDYVMPAVGEDTDLFWRFEMAGNEFFSVCSLAVQYHLWHKEIWNDESAAYNRQLMAEKIKHKNYVCINGIEKLG